MQCHVCVGMLGMSFDAMIYQAYLHTFTCTCILEVITTISVSVSTCLLIITSTELMPMVAAPAKWPPAWQLTTQGMRGHLLLSVAGGTSVLALLGRFWRNAWGSGESVWRMLSKHSMEMYVCMPLIWMRQYMHHSKFLQHLGMLHVQGTTVVWHFWDKFVCSLWLCKTCKWRKLRLLKVLSLPHWVYIIMARPCTHVTDIYI